MSKKVKRSLNNFKYGVMVATAAILLGTVTVARATVTTDLRSKVLGKEDSQEVSHEQEQQSEQQKQEQERQREGSKTQIEVQKGDKKLKIQKDGSETKGELETKRIKQQFRVEDGQLKLKTETKDGEHKDATEEQEREVERKLEKEDIKVATADGELEFEHGGVRTKTNFPLSINPTTNQLVVNTPAGQRAVAVLPDDAIQNLLNRGVLAAIEDGADAATASASLEDKNGELIYKVKGQKKLSLFGFIPLNVPATVDVSANTGEAVSQETSLLTDILSFFSR